MTTWIIWLTVAAVLVIIEILSQMVWTICLAIGCVAALAAALAGVGLPVQLSAMAVAAVVAYLLLMPYFRRYHSNVARRHELRTGMDALIGRTATVVKAIEPGQTGRVMADGDNWQAVALHDTDTFPVGDKVRIHSYDSIVLTVERPEA